MIFGLLHNQPQQSIPVPLRYISNELKKKFFTKNLFGRGGTIFTFFFVVPLGDEDRFRIREYEVDITHVTKKNEEWWIKLFEYQGFELLKFSYSLGSIKQKWIDQYPYGNGFFFLSKS